MAFSFLSEAREALKNKLEEAKRELLDSNIPLPKTGFAFMFSVH